MKRQIYILVLTIFTTLSASATDSLINCSDSSFDSNGNVKSIDFVFNLSQKTVVKEYVSDGGPWEKAKGSQIKRIFKVKKFKVLKVNDKYIYDIEFQETTPNLSLVDYSFKLVSPKKADYEMSIYGEKVASGSLECQFLKSTR